MGCPTRNVAHSGAGAALIKTPHLAQEIVRATRQGVCDWCNGATVRDCAALPAFIVRLVEAQAARLPHVRQMRQPIPVSVKTRIGYETPQVAEWIPYLLEVQPAALALHGRTLRQAYKGRADWEHIAQAAELARGAGVPVLGNGDVQSAAEAQQRIDQCGLDGVLIGRAACGNPFVFAPQPQTPPAHAEAEPLHRLEVAVEHVRLYESAFHHLPYYYFLPMRKHLAWYAQHLPGGASLRRHLLSVRCADEAVTLLHNYGLLMTGSNARNEL
jgi:tRNA-dihydrouridine synthase